tara:strand:+ start:5818 stop:6057 length:240 start_codon:yes stop_codon:yes gene_type:complete
MNSIALTYEELDALDDVLDIYARLHTKSVLIDYYFKGVNHVAVLKLHQKIIRKLEKVYSGEHMKINKREGRKRLEKRSN